MHRLVKLFFFCLIFSGLPVPSGVAAEQDWGSLEVKVIEAYQVDLDRGDFQAQLVQSSELININAARSTFGYRGNGYSVAVIDTGVDYNHPALGGGWGNRVIAGWDFYNDNSDPMDDNGHGTHVAGIIAGDHTTYKGIAPQANIVALKALGANGSGTYQMVRDALQWVIANHETYNIVAVNMSLGSGNYTSNPTTYLEAELEALLELGVTVVAASGNHFYSYNSAPGLAYPAISPGAFSVGAVYDANVGQLAWGSGAIDYSTGPDRVTSFSQRSELLDLMAPGALLTSTVQNSQFATFGGTSMAAPLVAGAALLTREMLDDIGQSEIATPAQIISLLQTTGSVVIDGDNENSNVVNTMLTFSRIEMLNLFTEIAKHFGSDDQLGPGDDNNENGGNENDPIDDDQEKDDSPPESTPNLEFPPPTNREELSAQLREVSQIIRSLRKKATREEQKVLRERLLEFSDSLMKALQAGHFTGRTARLARQANKALLRAGNARKKLFRERKRVATRRVRRLNSLLRRA